MFFIIIFSFFFGAIFIIFIEYYGIIKFVKSISSTKIPYYGNYTKYKLPKEILESISNHTHQRQNSLAFNLILQFLFKELKDTDRLKRWIVNKIYLELHDLTTTSTLGKVLGEIRVRDVNLGTYFPIINDVEIHKVQLNPSQEHIEELDLVMDVDYVTMEKLAVREPSPPPSPLTADTAVSGEVDYYGILIDLINRTLVAAVNQTDGRVGEAPPTGSEGPVAMATTTPAGDRGFKLTLDADIMFGRSARLSIGIIKLKGPVRLRFTRIPYTHWSFTFTKDPDLKLDVDCILKNKHLPHVAAIISSQIKKAIRRKHTYPHYKVRLKPFFQPPTAQTVGSPSQLLSQVQGAAFAKAVEPTPVEAQEALPASEPPGPAKTAPAAGGSSKLGFLSSAVRKTRLIRRGAGPAQATTVPGSVSAVASVTGSVLQHPAPDGERTGEGIIADAIKRTPTVQRYVALGRLTIGIVDCSRLIPNLPDGSKVYVTLSLDDDDWETLANLASQKSRVCNWKRHVKTLIRSLGQTPGFACKQEFCRERSQVSIIVDSVIPNSPAYLMDIRKGDIIVNLNGIVPLTVRQSNKLINQPDNRLVITLERYVSPDPQHPDPRAPKSRARLPNGGQAHHPSLAATDQPPDIVVPVSFSVLIHPPTPMNDKNGEPSPTSPRRADDRLGNGGPLSRCSASSTSVPSITCPTHAIGSITTGPVSRKGCSIATMTTPSFVHQKSLSYGDLTDLKDGGSTKCHQFAHQPRPESFEVEHSDSFSSYVSTSTAVTDASEDRLVPEDGSRGSLRSRRLAPDQGIAFYISEHPEGEELNTLTPLSLPQPGTHDADSSSLTDIQANGLNIVDSSLGAPKTHKRVKSLPDNMAQLPLANNSTGIIDTRINPIYPSFMSNWSYLCASPNRFVLDRRNKAFRTRTVPYTTDVTWDDTFPLTLLAPAGTVPPKDPSSILEGETHPQSPTGDEERSKYRKLYLNVCVWCEVPVKPYPKTELKNVVGYAVTPSDQLVVGTGESGATVASIASKNAPPAPLNNDDTENVGVHAIGSKTSSTFVIAQSSYELDAEEIFNYSPLEHGILYKRIELQPPLNVGLGPPTIFTMTPKLSRFQRMPIDQPPIFDFKRCYGDMTISLLFTPFSSQSSSGNPSPIFDLELTPNKFAPPDVSLNPALDTWVQSQARQSSSLVSGATVPTYHLLITPSITPTTSPDVNHRDVIVVDGGSASAGNANLKHRAAAGGKRLLRFGLDYLTIKQRQLRHRTTTSTGSYVVQPVSAGSSDHRSHPKAVSYVAHSHLTGEDGGGILDYGIDGHFGKNGNHGYGGSSDAIVGTNNGSADGCSTSSLAPIEEYGNGIETGQDVLLVSEKMAPVFHSSNDIASFTWNGSESESSSLKQFDTPARSASISSDPISKSGNHAFVIQQFPKGTLCQYCGKKIWFKVAYSCLDCFMICHKKCMARCQGGTICIKRSNTTPYFYDSSLNPPGSPQYQPFHKDGSFPIPKSPTITIHPTIQTALTTDPKVPPRPPPPKSIFTQPGPGANTLLTPSESSSKNNTSNTGNIKIKGATSFENLPPSSPKSPNQRGSYSDEENYTIAYKYDGRDDPTKDYLSSSCLLNADPYDRDESEEYDSHRSDQECSSFPYADLDDRGQGTNTLTNRNNSLQSRDDSITCRPTPPLTQDDLMGEARILGRQMLAHLPLDERKRKLNTMIDNLKREMEEEAETREEIMGKIKSSASNHKSADSRTASTSSLKGLTKRRNRTVPSTLHSPILDTALINCENRLESLSLIMIQYCSCLEQCMEEEEELTFSKMTGN